MSLFDGISCGQLAFRRAGIPVSYYYASEINAETIKTALKNFPITIEIGDVQSINCKDFRKINIDILLGKLPSGSFSSNKEIGQENNITTLEQYMELKKRGIEFNDCSCLFWEYVRILRELKPKYFLLETTDIPSKWNRVIAEALGINQTTIDTLSLSHKEHNLLFWTNIPEIQPLRNRHMDIDAVVQADTKRGTLSSYTQPKCGVYDDNRVNTLAYILSGLKLDLV